MHAPFQATNAPLTLNPEMLDEVTKYVFLPAEVKKAFRAELLKRKLARPKTP
jgi:hypothetical protein